jgi:tRNA threonylcarbamoyladenosine biosynthesis protein TsaB
LKLLALDTATEQCSVALMLDDVCITRCVQTPRAHADLILPMIDEVLAEAGTTMKQLNAIAFGRGPGAFTGVRIGIGVAQGLAFACDIPVIGISNLAAVAQQATSTTGDILVCMDARMNEVYWARFKFAADALVVAVSDERVSAPDQVVSVVSEMGQDAVIALGTGFKAYPVLCRIKHWALDDAALPRANDIASLAQRDFKLGLAVDPAAAQPVYLRDQVTHVTPKPQVS